MAAITTQESLIKEKITTPTLTPTSIPTINQIKYAPVLKPVKGDYNLCCVALGWSDNPGASLSRVANACRDTASIYKDLSGGNFNLNPIPKYVKTNFEHNAKNIPNAEKEAKKVIAANPKNNKPNLYAMVNNHAKNFSNGSGDTAHLLGTLTRDFLHEIGHCRPTVLGHSGKYDDKGKLLPYDDATSFMGRFSSVKLTGAQLYLLGWLPENKVAQYTVGEPTTEYKIENLYSKAENDAQKVVLIPMGDQRPLYLSMPKIDDKYLFALHLSSGRGTQRVKVFAEQAEYENLTFKRTSQTDSYTSIKISTKP